MDKGAFTDSPAGSLAPTVHGGWGFVPNPLPPQTINTDSFSAVLEQANLALGELKGVGSMLENPHLLVHPLQRAEALASSRIEGTISTARDVFLVEAGVKDSLPDWNAAKETANYAQAVDHAIARLAELPLSLRLIRECHGILLSGLKPVRSGDPTPGQFRTTQNLIGGNPASPPEERVKNARFIPTPMSHLPAALDDFEKYLSALTPSPAR